MPLLFYRPAKENFGLQSRANRQGRAQAVAPEELYCEALTRWEQVRTATGNVYKWLLEGDVARELARIDLPLSTYTQWYWKIDLHNLIHFLTLRIDDHAQLEIREYAKVLAGILQRVAPLSYDAWLDYELNGERFSCAELAVLRHFVDVTASGLRVRPGAGPLSYEGLGGYGLSRREIGELLAKLEARERPDFTLDLSRMCSAAEMEARIRGAVPGVG
jgi:thymidylate synthase ThyX